MSDFTAGGIPSAGSALASPLEAGLSSITSLLGITTNQTFATIPVNNNNYALYVLVIRDTSNSPFITFTFPLSPQSLSKSFNAMANIFDVNGDASTHGVQRIIDQYGNAPPIYTIEGHTGWKLHSQDGYTNNGLESIQQLEGVLNVYATLNVTQGESNQPPYTLEFYDYFKQEFWQVEPIGPQEIKQSAQRPLYSYYSFKFAAVKNLGDAIDQLTDSILGAVDSASQALGSITDSIGSGLGDYADSTPGGEATVTDLGDFVAPG